MRYRDRAEAGRKLAEALAAYRDRPCVVYALPRGGVPVAVEVARSLSAPLDLMLVRKIGAPFQPELALGAVSDGDAPDIVVNEDIARLAQIDKAEISAIAAREVEEIKRRRALYLSGREPVSAAGKVAILVDDGLATGATARAGLRSLRRQAPQQLVLAVPVAPTATVEDLKPEADEIVCLQAMDDFHAVGVYYLDFGQVPDAEVIRLLSQARR
jgi:putative phosphoribosyl transferase